MRFATASDGTKCLVYDNGEFVTDTYGEAVEAGRPRLRGCRCTHPCPAFRCRSRHHRHNRASPWCVGGEGESCAKCWLIEEKRRERAARRAA